MLRGNREGKKMQIFDMVKITVAGIGMASALAFAATAQVNPLNQRACAAGCLANSPGAASSEYSYCLQVKCGVYYEEQSTAKAAPTRSGWGVGVTSDGGGRFAGFSNETQTKSIYYVCDRNGASSISLTGSAAAPGLVAVSIDRERYELDFQPKDGALYAYAPIDSAVMQAFLRGSNLELYTQTRELIDSFSLRGAAKAITKAREGCG
jgi:hypothetical protein